MVNTTSSIEISIVPETVFEIGGFKVTQTMISCALTVFILIVIALVIRIFFIPRWAKEDRKKSGFRILIEYLVNIFDGNAKEQTGHNNGFFGPFYFSCSALICLTTLLEMFSLRPATTDFNMTLVFGLFTFGFVFFFGFKEKKARRLLHYAPVVTIVSDFVVPISIALRMFGSVFCGFLIMHIIYEYVPSVIHYFGVIGAFGNVLFTIFHALIQAYVYMFLSFALVNEATE